MRDFDLLTSPLQGTNLIEASAGTGKTFTITGIFLRLVLEKALTVDQILVVTFTRDATAELRERVRTSLKGLMEEIETPGNSGGDFLQQIAAGYQDDSSRKATALERLSAAMRNFDQAVISTIHGFCGRMLQENAFESASPFDMELITDQRELVREVVEDFWRKNFYEASPELIQCAQKEIKGPESLLEFLGNRSTPGRLNIVPTVQPNLEKLASLITEYRKSFAEFRQTWTRVRDEVGEQLKEARLHGNKYGKKIPALLKNMDQYLHSSEPRLPLDLKFIEKFTPACLEFSQTKQSSVPAHPFFDLCADFLNSAEEVRQAAGQHLLYLKTALFDHLRKELPARKTQLNIQFYDDLLLGMLDALRGETKQALTRTLRQQYRAVLIDEFQDTDPIQYEIFSRVFAGGDTALFLIGDPKQAIYGFRNADIFAYHAAARQVEKVYSLGKNWRSEPDLVNSVNTIFSKTEHPFVFDWIEFQGAKSAFGRDRKELKFDARSEPPFQLWFMDADKTDEAYLTREGAIKKPDARKLACKAVASEISRLLSLGRQGRAVIGSEPLKPGDIAVLVRRNAEAEQMRRALAELDIPSVLHERVHLFDTHEAMEMERVLAAVAEPGNERLLKAALTTDILGPGWQKAAELLEDERSLEHRLDRFGRYNLSWQNQGFIRMFAELTARENVKARLLGYADGKRRLTNLLQLAEVLHHYSSEFRPGIRGLLKWLSEQRDPNSPRSEEYQVRLETDEDTVRLVTIHSSKGLEYNIVFCPMAWNGSSIDSREKTLQFHDSSGNLTLDLEPKERDENRRLAETEKLAENLRLLYVSLTRAKNRCYLIWGRINDSWTSACAYLFHCAGAGAFPPVIDELAYKVKGLGNKQVHRDLDRLAISSGGSIALSTMPQESGSPFRAAPEEPEKLEHRRFSGRIERDWKIASFSSLVSGKIHEAELPDRDAPISYGEEEEPVSREPAGIFAFPRGARAGNFFHGLLEQLDFTENDPEKLSLQVARELELYGFEPGWKNEICSMLQRLFSQPLGCDGETFTLSQSPWENRLIELEFYFPLKSLYPEKLKTLFSSFSTGPATGKFPEKIGRLNFSPVRGFIKGFMDLVLQHGHRYYLVDWKSNYLGDRVEDYCDEVLAESMQRELYILQYHLYTVALDRYLRLRVPGYDYNSHFGGVYYIFLRGVNPETGGRYGLYYDLPSAELIDKLGRGLIAETTDGLI
jgi:exodeoxyribonuclease V beta subunit